jgi:hypothetical protein
MYITQPIVLDTYIPAAMDAQGWRIVFKSINECVMIPCIPDIEELFIETDDKSKYITMRYVRYDNIYAAEGDFELSAMGGTIPFKKFRAFFEIDESNNKISGIFWGLSNCLAIKGNGKNYKFSFDIVNQLCDLYMQLQTVGIFNGNSVSFSS